MATTQTPEVTWAQRSSTSDPEKNYVYLTISVPDVPKDKLKLDLKPTGLTFTGESTTKKTTYHLDLELFGEIEPEQSKVNHTAANIQLILRKKELKEEFWQRLLKDKAKAHFLRTDFDKWVDEDEQNEAPEEDLAGGFGGMGGEDGGFGGIDFSKLGGAGGMPGMEGLGDLGGAGEEEGESDDDMPELEDEPAAAGNASKPKIEEIN